PAWYDDRPSPSQTTGAEQVTARRTLSISPSTQTRREGVQGLRLPPLTPHRAELLTQAVLEVYAGARPIDHLLRLASPNLYFELQHQRRAGSPIRPVTPKVVAVQLCQLTPAIAEVSAVATQKDRTYAVALRLEAPANRWICTFFDTV